MTEEVPGGLMGQLSEAVGVSEPALKLLLGVLTGYPIALFYRKYIYNQDEEKQCMYFILCGLAIGFWNYGLSMLHCLFSILFTYCAIVHLGATASMVAAVFAFTFTYLLAGYFYSSTDSYDITWTMPYCILVLRLIGVAFDIYDGNRPKEKLSSDALKTALKEPPTLLQMLGHSLFPSGFLVGPQFSMRRFLDFIDGKFHSKDANGQVLPPDSIGPALRRFGLGILYLILYQVLGLFVPEHFLLSDEFAETSFVKKMFLLGLFGRYTLYKYIFVWLLSEGACILFGLAYNGEKDGVHKWNGVENIKVSLFEFSTEFNHYIMSFNVNTNQWVAQHIYKRLKFLGNRYYSQAGVLLFLAVWHGIHSGYYFTFLHEFVVMYMERDVQSIIKSNDSLQKFFAKPRVKIALRVVLHIYTFVFMGWAILPFAFLQYPRYFKSFSNCSYAGFIVFYLWPVLYSPLLRVIFKKKRKGPNDPEIEKKKPKDQQIEKKQANEPTIHKKQD